MARYDVYRGVENDLLLDLQSNSLNDLNTRFVVLLRQRDHAAPPIRRLNPILSIDDTDYLMLTQFVASVPTRELGQPLTTLVAQSDVIGDAIDFLLLGF